MLFTSAGLAAQCASGAAPLRFRTSPAESGYTRTGPFLDWGSRKPSPDYPANLSGEWAAVYVPQAGLREYSAYELGKGRAHLDRAAQLALWLVRHQDRRTGGWTLKFPYRPYGLATTIRPPWTSAIAQGQAISLLTRIYARTHDRVFLAAAVRALRPFAVPTSRGGVLAQFRGHPFYEEYPSSPPSLVLNGFILSLIGLYDMSPYSSTAENAYRRGLATLRALLPLYDKGRRGTVYNLGYVTQPSNGVYYANCFYTRLHVLLLDVMNSIAPDPRFRRYRDRWADLPCGNTPHAEQAIWGELNARWLAPFGLLAAGMLGAGFLAFGRRRLGPVVPHVAAALAHVAAAGAALAFWAAGSFQSTVKGALMIDGFSLSLTVAVACLGFLALVLDLRARGRAEPGDAAAITAASLGAAMLTAATDLSIVGVGVALLLGALAWLSPASARTSASRYASRLTVASLFGVSLLSLGASGSGAIPRADLSAIGRHIPDGAHIAVIAVSSAVALALAVLTLRLSSERSQAMRLRFLPIAAIVIAAVVGGSARDLRLLLPFGSLEWPAGVSVIAGSAVVVGGLVATREPRLPAALLAAAVAQGGYLLAALPTTERTNLGYAALALGVFALGAALVGAAFALAPPDGRRRQPFRFVWVASLLSLMGVPPLPGFFSRAELFRALVRAHMYPLLGVVVIGSLITLLWGARMLAGETRGIRWPHRRWAMAVLSVVLVAGVAVGVVVAVSHVQPLGG